MALRASLPGFVLAVAVALVSAACVDDVVLPSAEVTAECGNGVVEPGEACDVPSPGCVACAVVPTWSCTKSGCTTTCGDGVIGSGASCASPKREAACDLSGYWAARQSTYLRETILGGLQVSSNWFFFRLEQEGERFRVAEALDCGIFVSGAASVRYTPAGLRAVLYANRMDGEPGRPARGGTSRVVPGGCAVALDRWYAVRGLASTFLPADFTAHPDLASLPPLPTVKDPVATSERPEGAIDPDGDGIPGLAFQISGLAAGVRNSAQRDWKEFATPTGASVPAHAMTIVIPGAFDLQESVLRVTDCGSACGLLASVARVAQDIPARLALTWVGRTLDGPRTRSVVHAAPRADVDADLATCAAARLLLPHDPSVP